MESPRHFAQREVRSAYAAANLLWDNLLCNKLFWIILLEKSPTGIASLLFSDNLL